jgi:hypothetical protein
MLLCVYSTKVRKIGLTLVTEGKRAILHQNETSSLKESAILQVSLCRIYE